MNSMWHFVFMIKLNMYNKYYDTKKGVIIMQKTNAMRILDKDKIEYTAYRWSSSCTKNRARSKNSV